MSVERPTTQQWAKSCAEDGEFMLAARYWDGGLRLVMTDPTLAGHKNHRCRGHPRYQAGVMAGARVYGARGQAEILRSSADCIDA